MVDGAATWSVHTVHVLADSAHLRRLVFKLTFALAICLVVVLGQLLLSCELLANLLLVALLRRQN